MLKINAAQRLLADRDNANSWHEDVFRKNEGKENRKAKTRELEADNKVIDGLRAKIKDEMAKLKEKTGPALDAQRRLIDGLKKRANQLWHKHDFSAEPLYKV